MNPLPAHGWIILDKPLGLTSTQALGKARRFVDGKKAGHGGTLDPLASGILPLAFGEATKLIPYVMDGDKEYSFTIRWGQATETDDAEGAITTTSDHRPSVREILAALPRFTGLLSQTPPAYSAIKLDGERAYDIARAGGTPQIAPRSVMIHALECIGINLVSQPIKHVVQRTNDDGSVREEITLDADMLDERSDYAHFRVTCGKGMYVRSLARDLAIELGTCGHIVTLRRTRVGPFTLADAVTLDTLEQLAGESRSREALRPIKSALGNVPLMTLQPSEAHSLQQGQGVLIRAQHIKLLDSQVIFAEHQGVPVAIVEPRDGEFRVVRGFSF